MTSPVLFFDIGNTLGVAQLHNDALQHVKVFPFVPAILERLQKGCRLGFLSNTGKETLAQMQKVLTEAGILQFFDPSLQLFSSVEKMDKTKIEFFERAVKRSGVPASRCVYVSEDDAERGMARKAGMQISYHPLHVFYVIESMAGGE